MCKYLILGGAGYIGSHMICHLLDNGVKKSQIAVIDNLSRGHKELCQGVDFYSIDIMHYDDILKLFQSLKPDCIMHFAAYAYVGESVLDPSAYYRNNVIGSFNVLEAMVKSDIKNIVFSSTCATYGEPTFLPITEDHQQNPVNPYGFTKLAVENMLRDYHSAYGINSVSLRYFNAGGADFKHRTWEWHDPETHLIPLVLNQCIKDDVSTLPTLQVFGNDFDTHDGTCIRDYIHVTDIAHAHLLSAHYLTSNSGSHFFNLSNSVGYSVLDIIKTAEMITGINVNYTFSDRRPGDPAKLIGSFNKIYSTIGWKPEHDLRSILTSSWNLLNGSN